MGKNKKLGCLSLLLFTPMAMAMQPLDDKSLSAMTGQDGLSVSVDISKEDLLAQAKALPEVQQFLTGETKKEIVVPNKLVNLVV